MSIGISIYYKLVEEDDLKLIYGYSGADINQEYNKESLLKYDGRIEIDRDTLISKDVLNALKDKNVRILNECEYEWHHSRVINGEETIGFFSMKVIFKIFKEFKESKNIQVKGSVCY